jgi:hypothetical protein
MRAMQSFLPLITVFVSGLFGLVVALATTTLANLSDARSHSRIRKVKRYEDMESLYIDVIANFEKCIRYTQRSDDYLALTEEMPRMNARLQLASIKPINDQARVASDLLFEWSREYRGGAPKKIDGTGLSIIGSPDFPHQERAKALFPPLCEEIIKLTKLMKEHLKSIEV